MRTFLFVIISVFVAGCKCGSVSKSDFKSAAISILRTVENTEDTLFSKMISTVRTNHTDLFHKQVAAIESFDRTCHQKLLRKYRQEYSQLLKTAQLYDRMWQRLDSSGYARMNELNERIEAIDLSFSKHQKALVKYPDEEEFEDNSIGMAEMISTRIAINDRNNREYIEQIHLEIEKLELMQQQAVLALKIPMSQSDIIQVRALFLQNLEAMRAKLE